MKKVAKFILVLTLIVFLTGCGAKVKYYESISDNDLIAIMKTKIFEETGDNVDIVIENKEELYVCTFFFDGCESGKVIPNSHSFTLKITNVENPEINAEGKYEDAYLKNGIVQDPVYDYERYLYVKESFEVKNKLTKILEEYNITNYTINNNGNSHNIYIYSTNPAELNNLIDTLSSAINNFWLSINITNDYELFTAIDPINGIDGKHLEGVSGYDYNLLLNNPYQNDYSHFIIKVGNNGCISARICTGLYAIE